MNYLFAEDISSYDRLELVVDPHSFVTFSENASPEHIHNLGYEGASIENALFANNATYFTLVSRRL